jgi:nitroreductase
MFTESVSESWHQRYGVDAPELPEALSSFLTHRSVRRYTDEAISEEVLTGLIAAAQSAATSSNLQSWSLISVGDPSRRLAISELCGSQKQIVTAPTFLVFLADLHRISQFAEQSGIDPDGLDTAEMYTVAVVDASLAAERLVCAAEALGYGICYIGAIRNEPFAIKELLNLPEKVFGVFGLCIGTPAENVRADIKPKLRQDQIWFREQYPSELNSEEYDSRMAEFFATQGMSADDTWSAKSGQRVQVSGLSGREQLLEFLQQQNLLER